MQLIPVVRPTKQGLSCYFLEKQSVVGPVSVVTKLYAFGGNFKE